MALSSHLSCCNTRFLLSTSSLSGTQLKAAHHLSLKAQQRAEGQGLFLVLSYFSWEFIFDWAQPSAGSALSLWYIGGQWVQSWLGQKDVVAKVSLPLKSRTVTADGQIGLWIHAPVWKQLPKTSAVQNCFELQDLQFHFLAVPFPVPGSDLPGSGTAVSVHRAC